MKVKYAVTFEFNVQLPLTVRGEVEAGSPRTCAARAIDEAQEKHKGVRWNSMSILLERLDMESEKETDNETKE